MILDTYLDEEPRITQHTFLDWCWVCHDRFSAELAEERHHIIPRAYGGLDGPQVSLCATHHQRLHDIGLRLYAGKPFKDLLSGNKAQDRRVLYLAQVACNARLATENDPNKQQLIILHLRSGTKHQLRELKSVYKGSNQKLIEHAVAQLHSKHFMKR